MDIPTLIISIAGSSGLFAFIQYLITRHDGKNEVLQQIQADLDCMKKRISKLDKANAEQDAKSARARLLVFNDEIIIEGKKHSHGHWQQILDDAEVYETWANRNPDVKNGYAKQAVKNIKQTYDELVATGEWKEEHR